MSYSSQIFRSPEYTSFRCNVPLKQIVLDETGTNKVVTYLPYCSSPFLWPLHGRFSAASNAVYLFNRRSFLQGWRVYDTGPRTVETPLVFLHPVSGRAEVFFKQLLTLGSKGYRVISVRIEKNRIPYSPAVLIIVVHVYNIHDYRVKYPSLSWAQ